MRHFWSISALALFALFAAACSTLPSSATAEAPAPGGVVYNEAVAQLIAATRTDDPYQNTTMSEREPCRFTYEISPGRQSTLAYSFDVRRLNLDAVSAAGGQVAQSAYSRRIACLPNKPDCATYNGAPVGHIDIAGQMPDDLDRAVVALRQLQSICLNAPL